MLMSMHDMFAKRRLAPRWRRLAVSVAMAAGAAVVATPLTALPAQAAGPVVVSFTFDNQWANQMTAANSLKAHGMAGTFYAIAGWVGLPGVLSLNDMKTLVANGNEIGGKTVDNPPLPTVSEAEARRQICTGRNDLLALGFQDTDFAYPHAEFNDLDKTATRTARGPRASPRPTRTRSGHPVTRRPPRRWRRCRPR
jgi:peptidoglycan/xylan/chitin deacetylase (PgdA/CDA1 family)